ncbi:recombinase family protein [Qipengyuania sp. DGS5-3]|uniref:recombinase family protein n=1 Tax=Qipengyuania sp. DGS5-3 TaxID=3349632 RepID=UPI0036D3C6F0
MTRYVAYLRVSTSKQQKSGLGLAAQRASITDFLSDDDELVAEFVETASGGKDIRDELWNAIRMAKRESAKLLIAKLDRFSRKVSFISRIMDEGVDLVVAEMPTATDFQLHIFAALAQEERRLISQRTKAALAEAKRRGVKLGVNGKQLAQENKRSADEFAINLAPIVLPMLDAGMSYRAIADELNRSCIPCFRDGKFHPQTIKNLASRLKIVPVPALC